MNNRRYVLLGKGLSRNLKTSYQDMVGTNSPVKSNAIDAIDQDTLLKTLNVQPLRRCAKNVVKLEILQNVVKQK